MMVVEFDPEEFFRALDEGENTTNGQAGPASPVMLVDASETDPIPPRQWILGTTFCRMFLSGLVGHGAGGKTAVRIAQAIAVASGRPITGEYIHKRARVLYVTLEDAIDELRRRVRACRIHHGIDPEELAGWLFLWAPPRGMKLAEKAGNRIIAGNLEGTLRTLITDREIDVVVIDPFIKAYGGNIDENSNSEIDAVVQVLVHLSIELNVAPDLVHHDAKGLREPGNIDRGRGASALRDAGRLVNTLTQMSHDEAKLFGVPDAERRLLIRLDSAKINLAPARDAIWFRLVGVPLGNGDADYPSGDIVQTVERREPPDTWAGLSNAALNDALTEIDEGLPNGQRYSNSNAADKRAAWQVLQRRFPEKTEPQCREIIRTWIENEVLYEQEYQDPVERKKRVGLWLNHTKRPGM